MATDDWLTTTWTFNDDFEKKRMTHRTIHRMNSPFYEGERFCVRNGSSLCLNKEGNWEFEPMPSSRDDDFYKRCRFDTWKDAWEAADKRIRADVKEVR